MSTKKTPGIDADGLAPVSNETILKITKEIAIKFIEVGKITPASFELSFSDIYTTIKKTVREK